jgi:hypothetical protein
VATVLLVLFYNGAVGVVLQRCCWCCFTTVLLVVFYNGAVGGVLQRCCWCCFTTVLLVLFYNGAVVLTEGRTRIACAQ